MQNSTLNKQELVEFGGGANGETGIASRKAPAAYESVPPHKNQRTVHGSSQITEIFVSYQQPNRDRTDTETMRKTF